MKIKILLENNLITFPDKEAFFINRELRDNVLTADYIGDKSINELGENISIANAYEQDKKDYLKKLGELLPKKVIGAKKQIIGKPWLTDNELDIQLKLYKEKYNDAKEGFDVFEAQASKAGVTQEEYRNLIIQKGDEFILAEKKINDLIEAVRQLLEEQIDSIESSTDAQKVSSNLELVDSFTIETPIKEIFKALNQ